MGGWDLRGDRDLSTDIAELSDETSDTVVAPPQWLVTISTGIFFLCLLHGSEDLLRHLGHSGGEEEDVDCQTGAGDSQVDELDVGQVVGVGSVEECMRRDERADEGLGSAQKAISLCCCRAPQA